MKTELIPITPELIDLSKLDTYRQNIADRRVAEAVIELMTEAGNVKPEQTHRPRVWQELIRLATQQLDKVSTGNKPEDKLPLGSMTYSEGMQFAITKRFPRGAYELLVINEVPVWYIHLWADGDEFTKELRRYINSPHFRQRVNQEVDNHLAYQSFQQELTDTWEGR